MTEAEARTKWCPMARVGNNLSNVVTNRIVTIGADGKAASADISSGSCCVASDCMMWRWFMKMPAEGDCGLAS